MSFNGASSRVNIPDAPDLRLSTGMTIEAWVRPTTLNGWKTVVLKERTDGLAYALYGGSPSGTTGGPPAGYIARAGTTADIGAEGTARLPLHA